MKGLGERAFHVNVEVSPEFRELFDEFQDRLEQIENRITQVASVNDSRDKAALARADDVSTRLGRLERAMAMLEDAPMGPTLSINFDRDELLRGLHGITHALSYVGACPARDHASTIVRQIEEALKV